MKKTAVLSGLMALTLLLGGCSAQQAGGEPPTTPPAAAATVDPAEKTTGVGFYFDTVVTITLYGADDTLMDDIWAACKRYENMLSKTVEGSDVSRPAAGGRRAAHAGREQHGYAARWDAD